MAGSLGCRCMQRGEECTFNASGRKRLKLKPEEEDLERKWKGKEVKRESERELK